MSSALLKIDTDLIQAQPLSEYLQSQPMIQEIESLIVKAVDEASHISVLTPSSVEMASISIKGFGKITKQLESIRTELVSPINERVKEINGFFKALQNRYTSQEDNLRTQLKSYEKRRQAEEARVKAEERAEAERLAKIEAKRREEELKAMAEIKGESTEGITVAPAIIPEETTKTSRLSDRNTVGVTTRLEKLWRITDQSLIPREYFLLDEKKINAIRRASSAEETSSIPGIEFYTDIAIRG